MVMVGVQQDMGRGETGRGDDWSDRRVASGASYIGLGLGSKRRREAQAWTR